MTSNRIRVLYFINGLGTGGAERSLAELLRPLKGRGIDVTMACLYERSEGVQGQVTPSFDVRLLRERLWQRYRDARRLIGDVSPHIIHTTIFESDLLGRLSAIGTDVPVVTSIVNTSYSRDAAKAQENIPAWKLQGARLIDGFSARHLNIGFHAITDVAKDEAVRSLRIEESRIEVIPRGRDRAQLGAPSSERREQTRRSLGLAHRQPLLLSVGRREHQKGQVFAVQALAQLRSGFEDAILLIAGREGAASDELARLVDELELSEAVRFLGHRDDVPDLMVAADVLVFPSRYEGLGGTVIEAMALRLPVVASDIPVLREVARDAALFAPVGAPEILAAHVSVVLTDAELTMRMRTTGEARFVAAFQIDTVADQMADFYRRIVLGRRPTHT